MPTFSNVVRRLGDRARGASVDAEIIATTALLGAVLVIGVATAGDYGLTVDEFNTDDYGPKALAWYTSGFKDRSHFETVEFSLWYYGPWFQMLTAYVQSFELADRIFVRHVATFLVGLAGLAALLPIGRLAVGRWAGLAAIVLCLLTGYFYGSLFFSPIDVPFAAAMTWATLAILLMTRQPVPSWRATVLVGLLSGLAIGTRTGGIITHAYLLAGLLLCAVEAFAVHGRLTAAYPLRIVARYAAAVAIAWVTAFTIWPWLQIGNPFRQFKIALVHFATIPMTYEFSHWGQRIWTSELPVSYVPGQLLARLPEGFLLLLAVACGYAIFGGFTLARSGSWRAAALSLARQRAILVVGVAALLPITFLIIQHATLYDGIRHVLFVIPMLAVLAGLGLWALLPFLGRAPVIAALAAGAYVGGVIATLGVLHPLEYVATNALAGGIRGAYGRFELDYWSVAATEAVRRLEGRLDYDPAVRMADSPPSIVVCIPWREHLIRPMLKRPWVVETDTKRADFIIATERSRCGDEKGIVLIDEVKRFDRTFAWVYARRPANP